MSKERKENIKEMAEFYSGMQDTESFAESMELDPLCDEYCEEYELNGFAACLDCLPY